MRDGEVEDAEYSGGKLSICIHLLLISGWVFMIAGSITAKVAVSVPEIERIDAGGRSRRY